ncbi:eukaryotic translation initiation factor 2-alpha kinase-like, partial [Tropilaelaps mercedesae]
MNGGCTTFTRNEGDKNGPHKETPGPAEGDGAEADKAKNTGDKDETTSRAVLVIRRHTQTVRAIEPRSGREEWFYSVGVNELQFVEDEQTGCSQRPTPSHRRSQVAFGDDETVDGSHYETDLRVVVNKGVVSGTDHSGQSVNWSLELGSPIVGAWHLSADGILEEVDLFEPTHLVGMDPQGSQPIFYVGVFQQHLYLQQNPRIVRNNRMLANYWFNQQRGFGSIAGENRAMIEYSPTAKGLGSEDHTIGPQVLTMAFDEDNQGNDQQTALVPLSPREILEHVDSDNCFYFMQ